MSKHKLWGGGGEAEIDCTKEIMYMSCYYYYYYFYYCYCYCYYTSTTALTAATNNYRL